MRRFQKDHLHAGPAGSISSFTLEVPSEKGEEAVEYIEQFIERNRGGVYLHRGYLPEEYIDALVEIREANPDSKRDFSSLVEQLATDGETSEEVTEYDDFKVLEIESSYETNQKLNDVYNELESDEARETVRTLQDLMHNVLEGNTIRMYIPEESYNQITSHLSANLL